MLDEIKYTTITLDDVPAGTNGMSKRQIEMFRRFVSIFLQSCDEAVMITEDENGEVFERKVNADTFTKRLRIVIEKMELSDKVKVKQRDKVIYVLKS